MSKSTPLPEGFIEKMRHSSNLFPIGTKEEQLNYAYQALRVLRNRKGLTKEERKAERLAIYREINYIDPSCSPQTGKPYTRQTPLQSLSSELNWDLAQVRGASLQLQKLAHKYKVVFPKIFFKDIHAADIAVAIEKEIAERIKIARAERTKEIKEKAALDIKPST